MLFIGHTRFSLFQPNSTAWFASNNSQFKNEDDYREYLFSDVRLAPRIELFLNRSLPILARGSVGYAYYHVLSYSSLLPSQYRNLLIDAAERYPFLVLNEYVEGHCESNAHQLARRLFSTEHDGRISGEPIGFFRLDDDDLLSVNYFRDMSKHVTPENIGSRVTFGRGLTALYRDGNFENYREVYRPMIAIGLLEVGTVDRTGKVITPPDVPHTQSDRHGPVILDSRNISFIWTRHDNQDTALTYRSGGRTLEDMNSYPELSGEHELGRLFPVQGINH